MNELSKRAISGLIIIIWIFSTILYSSTLFIGTMISCLIGIGILEWPRLAKQYCPLFFVYPLIPFCLLIYLQCSGYKTLTLFTFASSFLFDSSAYIFGKLFGKHKIAPHISPGKTIEGLLGGSLSLVTFFVLFLYWNHHVTAIKSLLTINHFLVPLSISLFAFLGDLFESYLKRQSNIKDFGNLVPGHGGLLDRFDSILFVVIFVFLFRNYLVLT